jgi:hypothetical protein
MELMADAVAGTREDDSVFFGGRLYVTVVVGVLETGLEHVVVDVGDRALSAYARYSEGFELQIRHRTRGVLRESLINVQCYLGTRRHVAGDKVTFDDFLCKRVTQSLHLLSGYAYISDASFSHKYIIYILKQLTNLVNYLSLIMKEKSPQASLRQKAIYFSQIK